MNLEIRNQEKIRLKEIYARFLPNFKDFYIKQINLILNDDMDTSQKNKRIKIIKWLDKVSISLEKKNKLDNFTRNAALSFINYLIILRLIREKDFWDLLQMSHQKDPDPHGSKINLSETLLKCGDSTANPLIPYDIIPIKNELLRKLIDFLAEGDITRIEGNFFEMHPWEDSLNGDIKKRGQFFTPKYIAELIIDSVMECFNVENRDQREIKILDPSCGTGIFLQEAYEMLKRRYKDCFNSEVEIHKFILENCLFGIELEPLAIQLAHLNLLLNEPEGPIQKSFILHENTLLLDENKNSAQIQDFSFQNYDLVIGNPPYFLISKTDTTNNSAKQFHTTYFPEKVYSYLQNNFDTWPRDNKNPNVFCLFIEKGIKLLKQDGGFLGFIIPDIILAGDSTKNLRKFILDHCKIKCIYLIKGQVFEKAGISNIILILETSTNSKQRGKNQIKIISTSPKELKEGLKNDMRPDFLKEPHYIPQNVFYSNPLYSFSVGMNSDSSKVFLNLYDKLNKGKLIKLGDITTIHRGIENLSKKKVLDKDLGNKSSLRKLIAVDNIDRYQIDWKVPSFSQKFIDYNPNKYSKVNFKDEEWFIKKKIVLKRVAKSLIAALEEEKEQPAEYFYTLDSIQMIYLKPEYENQYDLKLILAILNSKFMNFYYSSLFAYKTLFSKVQKRFLDELPIPKDLDNQTLKKIHNLVDNLKNNFDKEKFNQLETLILSIYFSKEELEKFQHCIKPTYSLEDLSGLGHKKLLKLSENGIKTITDLVEHKTLEEQAKNIKGIGIKSLKKWQKEAKQLLE